VKLWVILSYYCWIDGKSIIANIGGFKFGKWNMIMATRFKEYTGPKNTKSLMKKDISYRVSDKTMQ